MKDLNEIKKDIKIAAGGEMISYDTDTIVTNLLVILEDLVEYIGDGQQCDRDKCPLSVKGRAALLYGEHVNDEWKHLDFETIPGGTSAVGE